jgi:FkbM family methyltransferase
MQVDFLGAKTRISYFETLRSNDSPTLPPFDEEYFEWVDLLESLSTANGTFTMMELGAGYGRWLVRAALACRLLGDVPYKLIGVEAEPTHFEWMSQHFTDNGIDPADHMLVKGAVSTKDGSTQFLVGNAERWYGQRIVLLEDRWQGVKQPLKLVMSKSRKDESVQPLRYHFERVKTVGLGTLLTSFERVDLIDLDVQGSELKVIEAAATSVDKKVKRVHVGTHNRKVEAGLRKFFKGLGWLCIFDFPGEGKRETPWGPIDFQDGVQSWTNPRLQS